MKIKVGETLEYHTTAPVLITIPRGRALTIDKDGACMLTSIDGTYRVFVRDLASLILEHGEHKS